MEGLSRQKEEKVLGSRVGKGTTVKAPREWGEVATWLEKWRGLDLDLAGSVEESDLSFSTVETQ